MGALQACAMTDLYIMARSDAPGIVKIGASQNVERRRQQLEAGHTFRMVTLASFPGAGVFEHQVHRKLDNARVLTGTGREWYRMSPSEAFQAASDVLFASALNPKTVAPPSPERAMGTDWVQDATEKGVQGASNKPQDLSDEDVEGPRKRARGAAFNQDTLDVLEKIYAGVTIDTEAQLEIAKAAKKSIDRQVLRLTAAGKPANAVRAKSDKVQRAILAAQNVRISMPRSPPCWEELCWGWKEADECDGATALCL